MERYIKGRVNLNPFRFKSSSNIGGMYNFDAWTARKPGLVEGQNVGDAVYLHAGNQPRVMGRFS